MTGLLALAAAPALAQTVPGNSSPPPGGTSLVTTSGCDKLVAKLFRKSAETRQNVLLSKAKHLAREKIYGTGRLSYFPTPDASRGAAGRSFGRTFFRLPKQLQQKQKAAPSGPPFVFSFKKA
ncbi:hypothetical protein [uncultured Hymenobacter sp.]|uniref:hypothetical protein n=1 Tax=uncultured Hymenobacter sp. TaxID=170016 RepID=UPI0035CA2EBF